MAKKTNIQKNLEIRSPQRFLETIRAEEISIQEEIESTKIHNENKIADAQISIQEIRQSAIDNARKTRKDLVKNAIDEAEKKSKERVEKDNVEATEIIKKGKQHIDEGLNYVMNSIFTIRGKSIKK